MRPRNCLRAEICHIQCRRIQCRRIQRAAASNAAAQYALRPRSELIFMSQQISGPARLGVHLSVGIHLSLPWRTLADGAHRLNMHCNFTRSLIRI